MENKILFKSEPLQVIDGIPVFSDIESPYIKNYQKIASDHVNYINKGVENPFIESDLWNEMENSTLFLVLKYIQKLSKGRKIKILDVGVGLGRLISKIKQRVKEFDVEAEYYGMDIALPYLAISKKDGINVILSTVEDMPYDIEQFDIIICTDVLEHVLDLNLALKNIISCLKRGGYLIIRVPNKEDLSGYLALDYPYYFAHLRTFDKHQISLLLSRVFNLDVIDYSDGGFVQCKHLLKYHIPIKGYLFLLRVIIGTCLKKLSFKAYKKFLKYMYEPVEINCVAKKP